MPFITVNHKTITAGQVGSAIAASVRYLYIGGCYMLVGADIALTALLEHGQEARSIIEAEENAGLGIVKAMWAAHKSGFWKANAVAKLSLGMTTQPKALPAAAAESFKAPKSANKAKAGLAALVADEVSKRQ